MVANAAASQELCGWMFRIQDNTAAQHLAHDLRNIPA